MTSAHWFLIYLYLKIFCLCPHFWVISNGQIFKMVAQAINVPMYFVGHF